ncbi:hypothetical protein H6G33_22415 [Calothrix sp. FACHB-1219]|uniref:hypothetical protein n=1 Tax=unclassified Calothrix TaxID=2619626 RepID=UPI001686DE0D|nr:MULTISPECIES: hypothetical protein [unclassified Calothrix]MBD2200949.1 hypothetical protein [Calothrix sp. FACHB-168]MBD2219773.1 hypothetical protein [Calothrix sp. FACHB-1219]
MFILYLKNSPRILLMAAIFSSFLMVIEPANSCITKSSVSSNLPTSTENLMTSKIETFRGKLIYEEIPPVMSVQAYLGEEFFLITNSQSKNPLVLRPTEKISRDQLQSLHQQLVEITAIYHAGNRPASNEVACPLDADGQCILQGAGYQVLSIKVLSQL